MWISLGDKTMDKMDKEERDEILLSRTEMGILKRGKNMRIYWGFSKQRKTIKKWKWSNYWALTWGSLVTKLYLNLVFAHGTSHARILEGIAISISRGSFRPKDWTYVSYIAGGFFTNWATKEALYIQALSIYHVYTREHSYIRWFT